MKRLILISLFLLSLMFLVGCKKDNTGGTNPPDENGDTKPVVEINYDYKQNGTLDQKAVEQFSLLKTHLLLKDGFVAENKIKFQRANLWTYSAYFTTVNQLYVTNPSNENKTLLNEANTELEWYIAKERADDHLVYASKAGTEVPAFFDDNVWLVVGWLNSYKITKDKDALDKAKKVMDWIYTGWQDDEVGGLYWREFTDDTPSHKRVRNTCITGPAAWASALLYEITNDLDYLDWSMKIYSWTKSKLYDRVRKVYNDNIDSDGVVTPWRFTYNQGTMISAASILYKVTKDERYKQDVLDYLEGSDNEFYLSNMLEGHPEMEFYKDNPWFRVYLVQGFLDATKFVDINIGIRLERVKKAILYGYENHKDADGFILEDWSGRIPNEGVGQGFSSLVRTLFVVGNIEILAILAQYEAYINEVIS